MRSGTTTAGTALLALLCLAPSLGASEPDAERAERREWLRRRTALRMGAMLEHHGGKPPRSELCLENQGGDNVLFGDWTGEGSGDRFELLFQDVLQGASLAGVRVEDPSGWRSELSAQGDHLRLVLRPASRYLPVAGSARSCFRVTGLWLNGPMFLVNQRAWAPR